MRTADYIKTLRQMTEATAPAAPPSAATPRHVTDDAQYETSVPVAGSAAVAKQIVAAGNKARGGGNTSALKLNATAEAILRAGERRRGESNG